MCSSNLLRDSLISNKRDSRKPSPRFADIQQTRFAYTFAAIRVNRRRDSRKPSPRFADVFHQTVDVNRVDVADVFNQTVDVNRGNQN
jgi:hypothetical protein